MNFSIITIVIAVAAIISPIFVAWINNHHAYKMRQLDTDSKLAQQQLETYYADKIQAYAAFVDIAASLNVNRDNYGFYTKFVSSAHKVLLLCDTENQKSVQSFIDYVDSVFNTSWSQIQREQYNKKLATLTAKLNEELMRFNCSK